MREIKKIQNFTDLLSTPQITEEIAIRSSIGVIFTLKYFWTRFFNPTGLTPQRKAAIIVSNFRFVTSIPAILKIVRSKFALCAQEDKFSLVKSLFSISKIFEIDN